MKRGRESRQKAKTKPGGRKNSMHKRTGKNIRGPWKKEC